MNKLSIVLLFAIIVTSALAHKHGHKCQHDKIHSQLNREVIDFITHDDHQRHLQTAQPRNFKITYDLSYFNSLPAQMNVFKKSCEKAIKVALKFFGNLIKIIPKPADAMKWDLITTTCGNATIPYTDRTTDKDSDLHLYITYTDEPDQKYLAFTGQCRFLKKLGPTHGLVNFNLGLLQNYNFAETVQFEYLIEIVIHEMLHVLGFYGEDIPYWVDSNKKPHVQPTTIQTVRGLSTTFIRTPNVLSQAKKYYGCESIPGMPFENQDDEGSNGSHWDSTAIRDEIMNASIYNTQTIFTKFTTALLRDTGFYYSVNEAMEEQSFYGKDEGCGFLTNNCDTNKREFCEVETQTKKCDYYYNGVGKCQASKFTDSGCNNYITHSSARCFDEKNKSKYYHYYQTDRGVGFGQNAKCFDSSLVAASVSGRYEIEEYGFCYKFKCTAANQVIVTIGDTEAICSKNGEKVNVPGYVGTLTCPEKLDEFCRYKKQCSMNCSSNGYCNNGVCTCIQGFTGAACQTPVS